MTRQITICKLSKAAEKNHRTLYMNIKILIKMYDTHPKLLEHLIKEMV